MRAIRRIAVAVALSAVSIVPLPAAAGDTSIAVVAAENFYGDVARQVGGSRIDVFSILNNPDQDPHLFETTPATVRRIADARIAIVNGVNYDPWMEKLLAATRRPGRTVITVAALLGRVAGDNPHLWYDPAAMPAVARALTDALGTADAAHKAEYEMRLRAFLASLRPLEQKVAAMRAKYAGIPVTATEPVFGYMANAIGLTMRNESVQRAVMNETEPAARDLAAFEDDLKQGKVGVLLRNRQVTSSLAGRLVGIATAVDIPVVGITETEPANTSYVDWMLSELGELERALDLSNKKSGVHRR